MRVLMTAVLLWALTACTHVNSQVTSGQSRPEVSVQDGFELSEKDVETILELASKTGFGPVDSISGGTLVHPGTCKGVWLHGTDVTPDSTVVYIRAMAMQRDNGDVLDCWGRGVGKDSMSFRGWRADPRQAFRHEYRRARVQGLPIEFELDDEINYATAVELLNALYRRGIPEVKKHPGLQVIGIYTSVRMVWDPESLQNCGDGYAVYEIWYYDANDYSGTLTVCGGDDEYVFVADEGHIF